MPNQRVYTFIGSNGVGKTQLLENLFMNFLCSHYDVINAEMIDVSQFKNDLDNVKKNQANEINKSSYEALKYYSEYILKSTNLDKDLIQTNHNLPIVMLGASARNFVNQGLFVDENILDFKIRKIKHLHWQVKLIRAKQTSLFGAFENLESWFISRINSNNELQKKENNRIIEVEEILKNLNLIDSRFDSSFIKIENKKVILKINNVYTELENLSSGFASLLRIIQGIISGYANFTNEVNLTHVKGVVFIDEIESHLHLEWQVKIIPLLKDIFRNTTFYIATHSPLILTQLQQGEAYRLVRDDGDGVVRSELIEQPSKKLFDDVLDDAFDINLNQLKLQAIRNSTDPTPKKRISDLLAEWDNLDKLDSEVENKQ
jgi:predicted ATPase